MTIKSCNGRYKRLYIRSILVLMGVLFLGGRFTFDSLYAQTQQTAEAPKKIKRPLTVQDIMKFKTIKDPRISENGKWLVYNSQPDRGNGEVMVYSLTEGPRAYERIPRGKKPAISKDGRWIAALIEPDAKDLEKEEKKKGKKKGNNRDKHKTGVALLDTVTGKLLNFENIKSFAFSEDSQWMVCRCYPPEEETDNAEPAEKAETKDKKKTVDRWKKRALTLTLRHLATGSETRVERVIYWHFDPSNRYLAYSTYEADGNANGLFVTDLKKAGPPTKTIFAEAGAVFTNLTWSKTKSRLAFIFHRQKTDKGAGKAKKTFASGLWVWDGIKGKPFPAVSKEKIPRGWMIPAENKLRWSEDGERLFFGFKPLDEYIMTISDNRGNRGAKVTKDNLFDIDRILEKRTVDVWHWKDPKIVPHQKKQWERFRKQAYYAIYHFRLKQFIMLADKVMPDMDIPWNKDVALGTSNRPYLRDITWDGRYRDVYISYLNTGFRRKILTRHQDDVSLSPLGKYVAYYKDGHWYLYDNRLKFARRMTANIETPFSNEDHDYPSTAPGYGLAGWTENDRSVLIYDKYDIWEFFPGSDVIKFNCLTAGVGRRDRLVFRIRKTDPEAKFFKKNEKCLLTAYSDKEKYTAFYRGTLGKKGVEQLVRGEKKYTFLGKAKKADRIIFTRESFGEFPDIWVSDFGLKSPVKVTEVNPQITDFLWGVPGLVEWKALDGTRLQGIVIKPENFDESKRYPVLIYFYRFFSQRLYDFNPVLINHRPCFPFYTGHDYVVFLPDVRFEVGHPGKSAFQCIVPGVQKLIDMGTADPKAVGIHGHSWSGYQTAFIVTQTKMFAAAVAGAPVSNMTSAYSGIRWGSGLARQFQYEKSQSRIGKTLWESPELYIENSPVFFADRVETPLLIQFGDVDGAVPWYQGIELYLAMRRLDKNCIFLQYNDEPHHLKKYPNKLDYTIKMKEYFDHYLKGRPAPDWITKGVPYKKKEN